MSIYVEAALSRSRTSDASYQTAKNRVHIDLRVAGDGPCDPTVRERLIRATVPELVALGGTVLREEHYDGTLGHVVMTDPEGNEFCVA